ncbi:MAG: N-acetyltransferase [Bacteroidota bacterium]
MSSNICVRVAGLRDMLYIPVIIQHIEQAAKDPCNGICKRKKSLIRKKILDGESIIACTESGEWAGFCYIQAWENSNFVSSCALVVAEKFMSKGIAGMIKKNALDLAKEKYPAAKVFGLTTNFAVMKINTKLGYQPVTYSAITSDEGFWDSCKTCSNFSILMSKEKKNCLCTAMLFENGENK